MSFKILSHNSDSNYSTYVTVYDASTGSTTRKYDDSVTRFTNLGSTIYGLKNSSGTTKVVKSIDEGSSWSIVGQAANYTSSDANRILKAAQSGGVTYVIESFASDSGAWGVSFNGGTTFTKLKNIRSGQGGPGTSSDFIYGLAVTSRYVYIAMTNALARYSLANVDAAPALTTWSSIDTNLSPLYSGPLRQTKLQVIDGGGLNGEDLVYLPGEKYYAAGAHSTSSVVGWYECMLVSKNSGASFVKRNFPYSFHASSTSNQNGVSNATQSRDVGGYCVSGNEILVGGRGYLAFSLNNGETWSVSSHTASSVRLNAMFGNALNYVVAAHSDPNSGGNATTPGIVYNMTFTAGGQFNASADITSSKFGAASGSFTKSTEMIGWVGNTSPTGISLSYASIAENAAANATVGTLSATDAENNVTSWALVVGAGDTDNASFMIVGDALKLANGVSLDYETKSSYSVRVQATDAGGLSFSQSLSVSVTNVNEAPTDIALSPASIQEGNAVNDVIGTLSGVDVDGLPLTFSIVSGGDKFNINGTSLQASVVFDYEVAQSHSVTIRATDSSGLYFDEAFTISVSNNTSDDPISAPSTAPMLGGKYRVDVNGNPKNTPVYVGQTQNALPDGSVVRNTATSKKYIKLSGAATNYLEINDVPPVAWNWSEDGALSWDILQDM